MKRWIGNILAILFLLSLLLLIGYGGGFVGDAVSTDSITSLEG